MAGRVTLLLCAWCFALLSLCGCRGTEHTLFGEIVPPSVGRPEPLRDAGLPPMEEAGAGGGLIEPLPPPDAGPPAPDPDLDESITFPWTETLPGKGTCRAGLYIGRFSCLGDSQAPPLEQLVPRTGQIVFTLEGSEEEQFLQITGGDLTDDLFPGFLWGATITGSLDCLNDQKLQALLQGDNTLGVLKKYETVMTGFLNSTTLVIRGLFDVSDVMDAPDGMATRWRCTFEANAAP